MALPYITAQQSQQIAKEVVAENASTNKSQLVVTYTAGEETNHIYPLSYSHTLQQIAEALEAGRDVVAKVIQGGETAYAFAIIRNAPSGMIYTAVVRRTTEEAPLYVEIMHIHLDEPEGAIMTMTPLATAGGKS